MSGEWKNAQDDPPLDDQPVLVKHSPVDREHELIAQWLYPFSAMYNAVGIQRGDGLKLYWLWADGHRSEATVYEEWKEREL